MAAALPPEWEDAVRRIKESDPALKELRLNYGPGSSAFCVAINEDEGIVNFYFSPEYSPDADFFARVGDAVGNNTQLDLLDFNGLQGAVPGVADNTAFLDGIKRSSSIKWLMLSRVDLSDVGTCAILNSIGENNSNLGQSLTNVQLYQSWSEDDDGVDAFKSTIRRCTNLRELKFVQAQDDTIRFHEILAAVSDPLQLEQLMKPPIGRAGFEALTPLLRSGKSNLHRLQLDVSDIDVDALDTVANVLGKSDSLGSLDLRLHSGIQSSEVAQFWRSFRSVLCDTSTINDTYFSNHTLQYVSFFRIMGVPGEVTDILDMNRFIRNKKHRAMMKVIRYHPSLDMTPFFEWDLKVLPIVVDRLEAVRSVEYLPGGREEVSFADETVDNRKIVAIYQFIRGMPEVFEAPALASGGNRKRNNS